MSKVFVLTSGEYSEYRIVGVCKDEETAKKLVADEVAGNVEPFELDILVTYKRFKRWECDLNAETAALRRLIISERFLPPDSNLRSLCWKASMSGGETASGCSYISREHALKLAVEARQEMLRDPHWYGDAFADDRNELSVSERYGDK